MDIYLDTSVLTPIYVPEKLSEVIISFLSDQTNRIYVSQLTEVELYSVFSMKLRSKQLTEKQCELLINEFKKDLESEFEKLYISDKIYINAIEFLRTKKTNLRTLDSLHLACAKVINASLVTADQELAKASKFFDIPFEFF